MNDRLEDLIRRSADEQGRRYRPSNDLAARVNQRRRQRAARRMTAAGVGMAAIVGVIGFAATRNTASTDVAASTTSTVAQATSTTVQPATTTSATPAGSPTSTTATTAVQTSPPPSTAPPLHSATPAPYASAGGTVWPYGQFWNVPQLGHEGSVRGTGCGSAGDIGDVIPDGLFAGFITGHDANNVAIDLLCVFAVPDASALPSGGATVVAEAPNYVIVNNSTRGRTMPMDQRIVLRLGVHDAGNCVDGTTTTQWSDIPADRQVWVRIHEGRVTWVFADCP